MRWRKLFQDYRIGFTDVVKRPSAGAAQLKTQDFREWAPLLRDKLLACRPLIAWFHGKLAYRNYLLYAEAIEINFSWGEQERHLGGSRVFVSPNPSSANAAISLQEIMASYQALKALRDRLRAQ